MKKSVLDLYLNKVSQGDSTYVDRLCTRIADRLLFIPLLATDSDGKEILQGVIPFLHIKGGQSRMVPAFTHEIGLREWCKSKSLNVPYASLLGYEICAALTRDIGLIINPGSESCVSLASDAIDFIASFGKHPDTIEPLGEPTYPRKKEVEEPPPVEPVREKKINVKDTVEFLLTEGPVSVADTMDFPFKVRDTTEIRMLPDSSIPTSSDRSGETQEIRIVGILSSKRPIITLYDVVEEPPRK